MAIDFDTDETQVVDREDLSALLAEYANPEPVGGRRDKSWINPADIREQDSDLWSEIAEGGTLPEKVRDLLTKAVLLPRGDFQIPIVASYLMLPSVFCNKAPIIVSQGTSGSGKSVLSHLACKIHSTEPLGAGSTFPSIRNQIRNTRFYDPDEGDKDHHNEKNTVLAWEDINSKSLQEFEGKIFDLLKLGVDRKGKISIAGQNGKNMEFPVFSPKLVSSIHPFYAESQYRELIRRIIVIEHKRFDLFSTSDESLIYSGVIPDDLIDIDSLDWYGLNNQFNDFWLKGDNAHEFAKVKRSMKKPKNGGIPTAYFEMWKDLMTTGVVCGYFDSVSSVISHFSEYYTWHLERVESMATGTEMLLRTYIKSKFEKWEAKFNLAKQTGMEDMIDPFRLEPSEIKIFLDDKSREGELEINPNARERTAVMEGLGYKLKTDSSDGKNYWYPANS